MTNHVFISYSREDYYFAESLTFHLEQQGVSTWLDSKNLVPGKFWEQELMAALGDAEVVLLVASASAFKSIHVEKEWRRALQDGKRLILINWPRRTKRPIELQGVEAVDFRGAFGAALSRLLSVIRRPSQVDQAATSFLPRLPPWVLIISAALVIPVLGYAFAVYQVPQTDDPEMLALGITRNFQDVMVVAFLGALVWWLCVSFIQRRMGMTRLVVCLGVVATPFVRPLIFLYQGTPIAHGPWSPTIARLIVDYWQWVAAFAAVPIGAALAVLFWRPEDLLRWMPTGKGWKGYRVGHVVQATDDVRATHTFESIGRFRLLCDPVDQAAAAKLRVQLQQSGSCPMDDHADVEDSATVLLVTNRTDLSWLQAKIKDLDGRIITVVGTTIALPQALHWLWHRQWLDHRRWDLRADERGKGLPSIPESMQNLRVPKTVAIMHGLQCAYAALLFVLGGASESADSGVDKDMPDVEWMYAPIEILDLSYVELMPVLTFPFILGMLYLASRFLARSMAGLQLKRWLMRVVLGGTVFGLIMLHLMWLKYGTGIEVVFSFIGLMVLPILGWHQRSAIGFWLPTTTALKNKRRRKYQANVMDSLEPEGNWRTFLTFVLFLFTWMLLTGLYN